MGILHWLAHGSALITIGMVLLAVGQPIFSDDTWWHLALGAAYAKSGPWLDIDPLAFTTLAPPVPASWLADLTLHGIWTLGGFNGLRLFHLAFVVVILALAWSILRRAARNAAAASILTALFAAISAYRFVQLRPHLFSIFAMLLLYRLLLEGPTRPSWARVAMASFLLGVWANVHPVYPMGPFFLAVAAAALWVSSFLRDGEIAERQRQRALRVSFALVAGVAATLVHPMGMEGYSKAFSVGSGSDSLAVVVDEWSRFEPFVIPSTSSPPSVLTWMAVWGLLIGVPILTWRAMRRWRDPDLDKGGRAAADPVLVALALAGLLAMLLASRFSWLGIFPIGLVASGLGWRLERPRALAAWALIGLVLPPAFLDLGDWPMITRGLPSSMAGYRIPYASGKYHLPALWFLADARLEGRLFGRYSEAGFQSFWLGPSIRMAMNGALNMPAESLADSFSIRERIGTTANPRFEDALDAMGIDLFLGTGLPMKPRTGRPPNYSTNYLEDVSGWMLVFRNLDSAIYLRINEGNAENFDRVAAYYASKGIRFDSEQGFDPAEVLRHAPEWARSNGVSTRALWVSNLGKSSVDRVGSISSIYLALGMYAESAAANRALLDLDPTNRAGLERQLWLEMRTGRSIDRARFERSVRALSARTPLSAVATDLLGLARTIRSGKAVSSARLRRVPIFSREAAGRLLRTMQPPEIRWDRRPQ